MEARNESRYRRFISSLRDTYLSLPTQGFESHLFVHSGWVFKVYRWFLFRELSLAEEEKAWERQQSLLEIYAPALEGHVIALMENGHLSTDLSIGDVFCYGLRIRKGLSFLDTHWKDASVEQRVVWAKKIGKSIAAYHQGARKVPARFYAHPEILQGWLIELGKLLERHRIERPIIPPIPNAILLGTGSWSISDERYIPIAHGDLNLANIVLYQGQIQFIDPGNALPWGVGMYNPAGMTLGVGWDLTAMGTSFAWHGDEYYAQVFLENYADAVGLTRDALAHKMRYWQILFYLMIVTICLKEWETYSAPQNPFARMLQDRSISLTEYTHHFLVRALCLLNVPGDFDDEFAAYAKEWGKFEEYCGRVSGSSQQCEQR